MEEGAPQTGWSAGSARSLARARQPFDGLCARGHLVDDEGPFALDRHESSAAQAKAVHVQLDRLVVLAVELDEHPLTERDGVGEWHSGAADLGPDAQVHVE